MCESFTEKTLRFVTNWSDVVSLLLKFFGGHFSFIASLGCQIRVPFKDCNQMVIICTSLYMHICKCYSKNAIFMQSVTTWTNVYIFYINLSVCRIWEPFFMWCYHKLTERLLTTCHDCAVAFVLQTKCSPGKSHWCTNSVVTGVCSVI